MEDENRMANKYRISEGSNFTPYYKVPLEGLRYTCKYVRNSLAI